MFFELDTNDFEETLKVNFTKEEMEQSDNELAEKFCWAITSFFAVFAMNLGYKSDTAVELKNACMKCISESIDGVLEEGIIEQVIEAWEKPNDQE